MVGEDAPMVGVPFNKNPLEIEEPTWHHVHSTRDKSVPVFIRLTTFSLLIQGVSSSCLPLLLLLLLRLLHFYSL